MTCHDGTIKIRLFIACMFCLLINSETRVEKRCGSIDIRNEPNAGFFRRNSSSTYSLYKDCTILDGDFTMSMIIRKNYTDDEFPVFNELREITGCILIFQVNGLTTLGKMFPNLRVIGGHSLIMNYALVIYQNPDLSNLGLSKLTVIRNGGVRITENPKLCFVRFINWDAILTGKIRDVIVETGVAHSFYLKNQVTNHKCREKEGCKVSDPSRCHKVNGILSCWNDTTCQLSCPYHRSFNDSSGPGCSPKGERCHEECIGGCDKPNDPGSCYACRHVENKGYCQKKCPTDMFEQLERRCVTKEECNSMQPITASTKTGDRLIWKPFRGKCHYECPPGFEEDETNKKTCNACPGHCPKKCRGTTIDSIGEASKLIKCNIIEGNLEVEMKVGVETISAEKFTEAFGDIEEITGYLLIRFSPAFTSLHIFKNLTKIHGQQLYHDRFALIVYENQNLRQLFHIEKRQISILNGIVSFQNNRNLCFHKIAAFLQHVGLENNVTENDVSKYSNGDKAVCDEIPLEVEVLNVLQVGFIIRWKKFNTTDMDQRKFLGYQVFYKPVEKEDPDMSIDDDRSACADSWKMQFVNSDADTMSGEAISGDPNTLYAFYVQTRLVNHPGARNAISKIQFVRTHFSDPDPPRFRNIRTLGPNAILLEWDPPLKPNGEITHYTVVWTLNPELEASLTQNPCIERPRYSQMLISTTAATEVELDTCPADKGCCKCDAVEEEKPVDPVPKLEMDSDDIRVEKAQFENVVQNIVFVQNPAAEGKISRKRSIRSLFDSSTDDKDLIDYKERAFQGIPVAFNTNVTDGRVNVSSKALVIRGLKHYTEYTIKILACQNVTAPENFCSQNPSVRTVRTDLIPENDLIDPKTVVVEENYSENRSRLDSRRITWKFPSDPNGMLLGFRVKVWQDGGDTPIEQCVSLKRYDENDGVLFTGLKNGIYSLEIRCVTSAGAAENATLYDIFEVYVPGWLTWDKVLYILGSLLLILLIAGFITYRYIRRHFGKKVQEYLRQTISANPEYLSQLDVYKADDWELKREDLTLHEEIGRGTFGKVFRGTGNNITSVCGVIFGKCAIKTVPECATNAERLHFLIEASVMKQFNTSFIVKLYGVVSDGQPVLVVMEMMDLGNLRDYLRARRPDSEENIDNAPLPPMISYFKWATQIADGMAYLESLKFCHRDLAARNCMVSADETVKIGDFGMARDIYYHEYYKPAGKRLMPVRWMAPESLKDGKFTVKSDVWSYGIVLYEMLTLGQQPYAGLGNDQVFNYIGVKRNILVRPVGCPDFWYDLMRVCWKYDPRERPCFYQIVLHLKHTIDTCFKEFPAVREQGLSVFEKCFVIQNFDDIEDEEYDFSYNEDEEEARKHKMLKELEQLQNQEEEEYYKQGAPGNMDMKDGEDGERFNMLTLQDLTHPETDKPDLLSKKQIKTRDKERKKFNKRQQEFEKKQQAKLLEEIELADQNTSSPSLKKNMSKPDVIVINEKDVNLKQKLVNNEQV
uniref:Receptor protein-tyrosine kinase n=1 Tax=Panagrolaimus sp. JU765 TaxID=591449 RepID=A0AC34Q5S6_9BILA